MEELLENHFDVAFASLYGIEKLRNLVLNLAMQGKLTPQDKNDQPAIELIKKIQSKRKQLINERVFRQKKPLSRIGSEEIPVYVPDGWAYVRLGDIFSFEYGDNLPKKARSNTGEFPVYGSNGIVGSHEIAFVHEPCIVIGRKGSAGALNLSLATGCCVTDVAYYCIPPEEIDFYFVFQLFQSLDFSSLGKGIKPGLNRNEAYELIILIPPLAEQRRIVAKIDQLMARCDELEKLREARDRTRIKVHMAACDRLLTAPDTDTFTQSWQFITQHFSELYTVKENVAELRKAILQLAVMGKLVSQSSDDLPAIKLIEEIENEKKKVDCNRVEKKAKPSRIDIDETTHGLPNGWEWLNLGCAISLMDAGWSPKCEIVPAASEEWGVLKTTSVQPLRFLPRQNKALPKKLSPRPDAEVKEGDILITRAGPKNRVGICCVARSIRSHLMLSDKIIRFRFFGNSIFPEYCAIYLNTGYGAVQIENMKSGMADSQMNISQSKLKQLQIAIPPLPEQHRIVAKVDQLMALCDTLEQQIDATTQKQTALLNAVTSKI